jgi:hypothetical protein
MTSHKHHQLGLNKSELFDGGGPLDLIYEPVYIAI